MISNPKQNSGSLLKDLKAQVKEAPQSPLYLLLAHADSGMTKELSAAFSNQPHVLLSLPQDCWTMDSTELQEMLQWATENLELQNILLVGHSQGGVPLEKQYETGLNPAQRPAPKSEQLSLLETLQSKAADRADLQTVWRLQSCSKQAEHHFLQELDCLRRNHLLQTHLRKDERFVQGLFFRAESGVFCAFDAPTRQFRALLTKGCLG